MSYERRTNTRIPDVAIVNELGKELGRLPTSEEYAARVDGNGDGRDDSPPPIQSYWADELIEKFPKLNAPAVEGLFRVGETCNIISVSKSGKSWLSYGMAHAYATRRPWLNRFNTAGGRVLIVDNELHAPTLAYRLKTVAGAMGIDLRHYAREIKLWPLRGNLLDDDRLGGPQVAFGSRLQGIWRFTPGSAMESARGRSPRNSRCGTAAAERDPGPAGLATNSRSGRGGQTLPVPDGD